MDLGRAAATVSPAALLAWPIRNIVPLTTRTALRELFPTQALFISITFAEPGTYSYHCLAHCVIGMTGVVNVSGGCAPSGWSAVQISLPTAWCPTGWRLFSSPTESFTPWAVAPPTQLATSSLIRLNMIRSPILGLPREPPIPTAS